MVPETPLPVIEFKLVSYRQQLDVFLLCRGREDSCGQRVFTLFFQAGEAFVEAAPGSIPWAAMMVLTLRLTFGKGARFIHDQRIHFFHHLEGFCIADQDPLSSAAACAHHDGHWRGQAQGTRARNDEHCHGVYQGMGVAWRWTKRLPRPQR